MEAMVFPIETEERLKRRALTACQEHLRTVLETVRKVTQMVDNFADNNRESVQLLHTEINENKANVDNTRRIVAKELTEIGSFLTSREDFLRFVYETGEIADFCEGISFRLLEITNRGWKLPSDLTEKIEKFSEMVLDSVAKLKDTFMALNYGSTKAEEKARTVELAEEIVDNAYRKLEIEILDSNLELPLLFLTINIVNLLEDISDKAEDASDAVRILAFTI